MSKHLARRESAKPFIERAIQEVADNLQETAQTQFLTFLSLVRRTSLMLRPAHYVGRVNEPWIQRIVQGLLATSLCRRERVRPLETWSPAEVTPLGQFSSLVHHLFAEFRVPPVFLSVWFLGTDWPAEMHQNWFLRLGKGASIRELELPLSLTRKMAHELTHAPADLEIEPALRWAQVRGLGGSNALARALADSRMGHAFDDEPFWLSAIHLLMNEPSLDLARVPAIVDYLFSQKCEQVPVIIGDDTEIYLDPPQPDLCLKGWTLRSLLRRVEAWEAERRVATGEAARRRLAWNPTSIAGFEVEVDAGVRWTIRELLDSDAMAAEGKAMEHCVASYTKNCAQRSTSIWSLGLEVDGAACRERAVTIEVDPSDRVIRQARMHGNDAPNDLCMALIHRWARGQSLTVGLDD